MNFEMMTIREIASVLNIDLGKGSNTLATKELTKALFELGYTNRLVRRKDKVAKVWSKDFSTRKNFGDDPKTVRDKLRAALEGCVND